MRTEHQLVCGRLSHALVGSWKILLHTPIDPPTAGTAAPSPPEQRQTVQEVIVFLQIKGRNVLLLGRKDKYWGD